MPPKVNFKTLLGNRDNAIRALKELFEEFEKKTKKAQTKKARGNIYNTQNEIQKHQRAAGIHPRQACRGGF